MDRTLSKSWPESTEQLERISPCTTVFAMKSICTKLMCGDATAFVSTANRFTAGWRERATVLQARMIFGGPDIKNRVEVFPKAVGTGNKAKKAKTVPAKSDSKIPNWAPIDLSFHGNVNICRMHGRGRYLIGQSQRIGSVGQSLSFGMRHSNWIWCRFEYSQSELKNFHSKFEVVRKVIVWFISGRSRTCAVFSSWC